MASYYIFYVADDPEGKILSVAFIEQEEADEAVAVDPTLAYVISGTDINKDDYYITVGPPRALSLKPPVVPPVMWRAFYALADTQGKITMFASLTLDDANMTVAADTSLGYVTSSTQIDPDRYYVDNGVLTVRPLFNITTDKTSILANRSEVATISGIPDGTLVTLTLPNDNRTASETVTTGSTTLRTHYDVDHIFDFALHPYYPFQLTIKGT